MGLVISRNAGESFMIGDDIRVEIVRVQAGKVLINIDAPKEVSVHRLEVYEAIQRQKGKE